MFLCFGKYFDLWDLSEMMMVGGGSKVLVTSYQVSRNDLFLIDWWSLFCFISLIWRHYHCRKKAAKYRLCAALATFKQEEIFIEPYLLWHRTSVFFVSAIKSLYTRSKGNRGPILYFNPHRKLFHFDKRT